MHMHIHNGIKIDTLLLTQSQNLKNTCMRIQNVLYINYLPIDILEINRPGINSVPSFFMSLWLTQKVSFL